MGGNDVFAGLEELLELAVEVQLHTIAPCLAGIGNLGAVDVDLEHVVVRIDEIEVVVEIVGAQLDVAAHIEVAVQVAPVGVDIAKAVAAPCCASFFPTLRCEIGLLPSSTWVLACVETLPGFFRCHGHKGLKQGALLGSHEAVDLSIDTEQTLEGLLVVGPVACVAVGQFVIGRPYREVRV